MAEAPLLSQDEFFRHLNLQSVHHTSARYHYRQALKERLRASSAQKVKCVKSVPEMEKKSPQVSPCKWLSQDQCRKLFGRPKIRKEKIENPNEKLCPLIKNCHLLRHPGIKREFGSKKIDYEESQILSRKDYLPENHRPKAVCDLVTSPDLRTVASSKDFHCKSLWPQPGRRKTNAILDHERVEKHKMVAKLNDLVTTMGTLKAPEPKPTFKKSKFPRIRLSGSNNKLLGEKQPLRPLKTHVNVVKAKSVTKPVSKTMPQPIIRKPEVEVKTKFGTSMSTCRVCGRRFKVRPLRNWKEALEGSLLCEVCKTLIHSDQEHKEPGNKCDICSKRFGNRSNMIRHITSIHPLKIHKVELAKLSCKTPRNGLTKLDNPGWLDGPPTYLKTIAAQAQ